MYVCMYVCMYVPFFLAEANLARFKKALSSAPKTSASGKGTKRSSTSSGSPAKRWRGAPVGISNAAKMPENKGSKRKGWQMKGMV